VDVVKVSSGPARSSEQAADAIPDLTPSPNFEANTGNMKKPRSPVATPTDSSPENIISAAGQEPACRAENISDFERSHSHPFDGNILRGVTALGGVLNGSAHGLPMDTAASAFAGSRMGSRVDGFNGPDCRREDRLKSPEQDSNVGTAASNVESGYAGPSDSAGHDVKRQIDMQIEMQERTMQLQLQMQMLVHRTISLHRKLETVVARQTALVPNPASADDGLTSEHRTLIGDQREIERELKKQQSLLKQQMDCQERVRRKLLEGAEAVRDVDGASMDHQDNTESADK
jgi:hypothetical protein